MSLFTMTDTQIDVPIASFDGDGSDLISLIVGIDPVQAGSGDPSPDNVRPITGWTGANIHVSPATDAADGDTYTITFPSSAGTVYGGTLDVTTGKLTVDRAQISSYAGETLPGAWISDRDVYAAGATPTTGAQVVYELATPITYTLTPQQIALLRGNNNVWADTGDTTLAYRQDVATLLERIGAQVAALNAAVTNA